MPASQTGKLRLTGIKLLAQVLHEELSQVLNLELKLDLLGPG